LFKSDEKSENVTIVAYEINAREHPRGNRIWTIRRNWQHWVHKTKKRKQKTQHNISWTPLCGSKHK